MEPNNLGREKICQLPQSIIQQIAAGEVVTEPAAVVKELVDNSIDAGATTIEIRLRNGGKTFISVLDDGLGMPPEELPLAFKKHTTSKLSHLNLYDIQTMGFRGEALFSISYVSKVVLRSRIPTGTCGYEINIEGETLSEVKPCNLSQVGTYVEVRDLFFGLPARLKFLRSDHAEAMAVYKVIEALAMANPHINFTVHHNGKLTLNYCAKQMPDDVIVGSNGGLSGTAHQISPFIKYLKHRCNEIWGNKFVENCLAVHHAGASHNIYGLISLPTYSTNTSAKQLFLINKRPIKDRVLHALLKAAYANVIEKGKHPLSCLFIDIQPNLIDVNVSPAKTEVKFADLDSLKSSLIATIKSGLKNLTLQRTSSHLADNFIDMMVKFPPSKTCLNSTNGTVKKEKAFEVATPSACSFSHNSSINSDQNFVRTDFKSLKNSNTSSLREEVLLYHSTDSTTPLMQNSKDGLDLSFTNENVLSNAFPATLTQVGAAPNFKQVGDTGDSINFKENKQLQIVVHHRLGEAKAQYNTNWIIAENQQGLVIVDQHAAHERIFHQRLYQLYLNQKVTTQMLLLPTIISKSDWSATDIEVLLSHKTELEKLGIVIDKFGQHDIIVREIPSLFGNKINVVSMLKDVVEELKDIGFTNKVELVVHRLIATMACHSSVRAGDSLSVKEMNHLLRDIEKTEHAGECPHGRPTYIEISWKKLEKLFSRG